MIGETKYPKLTKWEKHEVKQMFIREYANGKFKIVELAQKYKVDKRTVSKWKIENFGKRNVRAEIMYKMHISGLSTRVIAEFYGVSVPQVWRSINEQKGNPRKSQKANRS